MRAVGQSGGASLLDYINNGSGAGSSEMLNAINQAKKVNRNPNQVGNDHNGSHKPNQALDAAIKKANEVCDETVKATVQLRKSTEALSATGKDSIFAKAKESGNTTEIVAEVTKFIEQYNAMVKNMGKTGGTVNTAYEKHLTEELAKHGDELKALGITTNKDGVFIIDSEKIKSAKIEDLQKVFTGTDSFAGQISVRSIYIEAHAVSTKSKNEYSAQVVKYNGYGNYGKDTTEQDYLGGLFNSKQ
ncbi:MAG: hypothetical protein RRX92_06270 [Lachnospiraceae bacterium]